MSDEQRKAFAQYMGSTNNAGQQLAGFANARQQYLYPVGKHSLPSSHYQAGQIPPAAPTPPPAVAASLASNQVQPNQQQALPMPPPPRPPGYADLPRSYNIQTPAAAAARYSVGWQYNNPVSPPSAQSNIAMATSMAPTTDATCNAIGQIIESKSKESGEQYHYHQHQYLQTPPPESPPAPEATRNVPVLLCHTCSVCGRMRSAGYHRSHPVVPGQPLVPTACRRCKKKSKKERHSSRSYTHIRTCTADEPCDWPNQSVHIEIDNRERRGRRRSRDKMFVVSQLSPSRPRAAKMSESRTRLGIRVLEEERNPPATLRRKAEVGTYSSRYDGPYPPPDIELFGCPKSEEVHPTFDGVPNSIRASRVHPNSDTSDRVWPPPDGIHAHLNRVEKKNSPPLPPSSLRCQSSRVFELSPSPPPARTRSTRLIYRSGSHEQLRRERSISPNRDYIGQERRHYSDAESRLASHPRAYRSVLPDQRAFINESEETSTSADSASHLPPDSPTRGILKQPGMDRQTSYRRRMSMNDSQDSTMVEVGGPRVQFVPDSRREDRVSDLSREPYGGRARSASDGQHPNNKDYDHHCRYKRGRYPVRPPPSPPTRRMERLDVGCSSPSPPRRYEKVRVERTRRASPSPTRYQEVHIRHVTPSPPRSHFHQVDDRTRAPEPLSYSSYQSFDKHRVADQQQSLSPLAKQKDKDLNDVTDSDSEYAGNITEVRRWRGVDENGQPATFIEERRTIRLLESEREKESEFRQTYAEAAPLRSFRDV